MKVICNRGALLEALTVAGNVVVARTPKPVLQCVKLVAAADKLTLSATDLEVAIRYTDAQVQVESEGETLVPADKLRDIVRESTDDTLSFELVGEQAVIKGADSQFKIYTQRAEEFPPIPEQDEAADFTVPGGQLKQLIGQTLFAAAREGTRYAFNGVLLTVDGPIAKLVSTDGRRLAQAKGGVAREGDAKKDLGKSIVPAKALNLVDKLIADPEQPVGISIRENQIVFHTPRRDADEQSGGGPVPAVRGRDSEGHGQEDDRRHGRVFERGAAGGAADHRGEQGRAHGVQFRGRHAEQPQRRERRGGGEVRLQVRRRRFGDRLQPAVPDRRAEGGRHRRDHAGTDRPEPAGAAARGG